MQQKSILSQINKKADKEGFIFLFFFSHLFVIRLILLQVMPN